MGFHATINAGNDAFGNMRHKVAPRVNASPRVTGYSQQVKSDALAGAVTTETGPKIFSDTSMALTIALAGRKVTDMTATFSQYRKVTATRWELNMRNLGGRIVVRKVTTKDFNGWLSEFHPYTGGRVALGGVGKGQSIDHNGESSDARRLALVKLHNALIRIAAR